jgi:hypothetical protein
MIKNTKKNQGLQLSQVAASGQRLSQVAVSGQRLSQVAAVFLENHGLGKVRVPGHSCQF